MPGLLVLFPPSWGSEVLLSFEDLDGSRFPERSLSVTLFPRPLHSDGSTDDLGLVGLLGLFVSSDALDRALWELPSSSVARCSVEGVFKPALDN